MQPSERLLRLLAWCRFQPRVESWDHGTASRCRRLLPQIAHAAEAVSDLPPMFQVPLMRYLSGDSKINEIFDDDARLLLMLSDLRDYLSLMKRGYL